jgi:fatty-acyl-CoA synthase
VLRPGAQATQSELEAWCKDRIAGFKRPKAYRFIAEAEMPRTATGKIQHRVLRDRLVKAALQAA